jgi:hypothetical protein
LNLRHEEHNRDQAENGNSQLLCNGTAHSPKQKKSLDPAREERQITYKVTESEPTSPWPEQKSKTVRHTAGAPRENH